MKKILKKQFLTLLAITLFISSPGLIVKAQSENHEIMIAQYYDLINLGLQENVQDMYGEELNEFVADFFVNEYNKTSHEGIFNVIRAEVLDVEEMDQVSTYLYGETSYSDVKTYFVKCNMDVYKSDKYYSKGINYFVFYIGKDLSDNLKIANIEIPSSNTIKAYDLNATDTTSYIKKRNEYIYGGISTLTDAPSYIDSVRNPSKIRVLYNGSVVSKTFTEYLKVVASNEMNTISNTNGARACAMAIKMFAMHYVNTAGSGSNYDINDTVQVYKEGVAISTSANNAVNYILDYFLLDYYGANFKTFYRTRESNNSYCKQYGGILAQIESNTMGATKSWQDILRYYYTRTQSVSYYNSLMNYGSLIIASAHTHDWGSGVTCTQCGAIAK